MPRVAHLAIAAVSTFLLSSGIDANRGRQDSDAGGWIMGQAVDATTRKGVPGALITIAGDAVRQRALAAPDGHYFFTGLPRGRYSITAAKAGYVAGGHGMRRPNGSVQPITLHDGERVTDATVVMWKDAAISGTVLDEAGEPVVGLQVQAIVRGIMFGNAALASSSSDVTDDRGAYRIASLVPGDYIVCAPNTHVSVPVSSIEGYRRSVASFMDMAITGGVPSPGTPDSVVVGTTVRRVGRPFTPPPTRTSGSIFVYPTTCFPDALSTDSASLVSITSGEERPGVDFQIVPVPTVSVSGVISGPEGYVGSLGVRLTPAHDVDSGILGDTAVTVSAADGAFKIEGVPPGDYVMRIERAPRQPSTGASLTVQAGSGMIVSNRGARQSYLPAVSPEPTLWAEQPISVARTDVTGVNVSLRQGIRVSGRVQFAGTMSRRPSPDQIADLPIVIEAASRRSTRGMQRVVVGTSGQFTSIGIPAGHYFIRVIGTPLPGWALSSITFDGRDVADTPIELAATDITGVVVSFTNRPTELSGTVHEQTGAPDGDATVLIFPIDVAMWRNYGQNPRRLQGLRASRNGAFSIRGLPAGEYHVAAVFGEAPVDWREPEYLERVARGSRRLRLAESEQVTQDLQSREVR
jgi:hypothetical protein